MLEPARLRSFPENAAVVPLDRHGTIWRPDNGNGRCNQCIASNEKLLQGCRDEIGLDQNRLFPKLVALRLLSQCCSTLSPGSLIISTPSLQPQSPPYYHPLPSSSPHSASHHHPLSPATLPTTPSHQPFRPQSAQSPLPSHQHV
jgi:hypothetical protein